LGAGEVGGWGKEEQFNELISDYITAYPIIFWIVMPRKTAL
jgi:hypothetical protein